MTQAKASETKPRKAGPQICDGCKKPMVLGETDPVVGEWWGCKPCGLYRRVKVKFQPTPPEPPIPATPTPPPVLSEAEVEQRARELEGLLAGPGFAAMENRRFSLTKDFIQRIAALAAERQKEADAKVNEERAALADAKADYFKVGVTETARTARSINMNIAMSLRDAAAAIRGGSR